MRKSLLILLTLILAAAWSCSEDRTTTPAGENQVPADVQKLIDRFAMPVPMELDPAMTHIRGGNPADSPPYANYDVYAITILWGSLMNLGGNPGTTVDWSGTVSVNGVVTFDVLHTVSFETNQDHLIPTNNPALVAWESFTTNDFDGINCLLYVDKDIVYVTQPLLTFDTDPFAISYGLEELSNLTEFHLVNNTLGFAIAARKIYSNTCPAGMINGFWIRDDLGGATGSIQGEWLNADGSPVGPFAGTFATSNTGLRTFEGVVSEGALTVVKYYVYGTWYYDDPSMCPICGTGHGQFAGFYTDMNRNLKGVIKGEFGWAPSPTVNQLPMTGQWIEMCRNSAFAFHIRGIK